MPANIRALRRLSLLAGSSFLATGLLALTPGAALAANECGNPSANAAAADTLICVPGAYAAGIDYSTTSDGDLTVVLRDRVDTGTSNIAGVGPIVIYGDVGEDMSLIRQDTPSVVGDPRIINTTGRAIDVSTQGDGNVLINLTDGDPAAGEPTTPISSAPTPQRILGSTDAIRAQALGTGAVSVIMAATNPVGPITAITAGASGGSGVVARTVSGAINVDTRGAAFTINATNGDAAIDAVSTSGNVTVTAGVLAGRRRGVLAQTGGAGAVSVTVNGNVTAHASAGLAGIEAIAGTGGAAINIVSGTISGGAGPAIRVASQAAATVQNAGTVSGRMDFSGVTAGGVAVTGGIWTASGASFFSGFTDTVSIASGSLAAGAAIDFAAGADTFSHSGAFTIGAATINFGTGADVYNLNGKLTITGGALNFGGDNDTFNQNSVLVWNGGTISGLEAFNNAGTIFLGGQTTGTGDDNTDGNPDDVMRLSSGVFTGSGDGRVVLDVNLGIGGVQTGCTTVTIADCLSLTGASTAGSTMLTIRDVSPLLASGTFGSLATLVEGSSAKEHFVLDPASQGYGETSQGSAVRKALVGYRLFYDAAGQRHLLLGAPVDEVYQVGTFAASLQEAWRATGAGWFARQADLRSAPGGVEDSNGVWARLGVQSGERDASAAYTTSGVQLDYDLSQKQKIANLVFGVDMLRGSSESGAWVFGGMAGFVRSDIEFDATPTEATLTGVSGGLYGSYLAGPFFVDATANLNITRINAEAPRMGFGPAVPLTFEAKSLGAQFEAGWRIDAGSGLFVEPLVGVSYVSTGIDDAKVPDDPSVFDFDDNYDSLRLGAGARVGMDGELMGVAASYSLTGRYWDDSEARAETTVMTGNGSTSVGVDDFGGGFSEVAGSLNLYSPGGALSGFVNLGGKFADGYSSIDTAVGVRVRW